MPAWLYRAAFIALLSALSLLRLAYRLKARVFSRGLWSPEEPSRFIVARSLLGLPLAAGVFCYCFLPDRFPWLYLALPGWARLAGLPLGAGALALLARVHAALGEGFSTGPGPRAERLVREGPYARIRHPMYLAYLLLFTAASLLVERYGEEYLEYRRAAGAFLPRLLRPGGAPRRGTALPGARLPGPRRSRSPRRECARPG